MVSENSNTSEGSFSETIVISLEDVDSEDGWRRLAGRTRESCARYEGVVTGAIVPALIGGLVVGLLLYSQGAAFALTGGVFSVTGVLALAILAERWGWTKRGDHGARPAREVGAEGIAPPSVVPPMIIRPEDIPIEPEPMEGSSIPVFHAPSGFEANAAISVDEAVCPYCGLDLADRPVQTCRYCRTPHHKDCWDSNRGCTILGCRTAPRRRDS